MAEEEIENIPLVSVITPCYNQGQYLEESINSLINQTYSNWECIILNDGSVDNTEEIALKLSQQDKRIKYLNQDHKGVSSARNNAIKHSKGKYLLPLDADDLISPLYIEECVAVLDKDESVKIVYCEAEKFGLQTGIWDRRRYDIDIMKYDNLIFVSAMYRKVDWEKTGGYSEELSIIEDWEFWLKIIKNGGNVVKLPIVGLYYRVHNLSKTRTYDWNVKDAFDIVYKKHFDFFFLNLGNPILLYRENQNNQKFINQIKTNIFYKAYKIFKNIFN